VTIKKETQFYTRRKTGRKGGGGKSRKSKKKIEPVSIGVGTIRRAENSDLPREPKLGLSWVLLPREAGTAAAASEKQKQGGRGVLEKRREKKGKHSRSRAAAKACF